MVGIREFISRDNEAAAIRVLVAIDSTIQNVAMFPRLGRPGRLENTRELGVGGTPYVVVYQVLNDEIYVERILHGAMDWPPGHD